MTLRPAVLHYSRLQSRASDGAELAREIAGAETEAPLSASTVGNDAGSKTAPTRSRSWAHSSAGARPAFSAGPGRSRSGCNWSRNAGSFTGL